jgi:tRNA1(Val) A37 N6-methylase TrmN6
VTTPEPDMEITEDMILGGRVRLRQPASGARASIDPVFLAATIEAEPSHQVLDIGCGPGTAMLCLAARLPQCRIFGLEMQRELVHLAGDNLALNGMTGRLAVMIGDLMRPPPRLSFGSFDHVMANPPFLVRGSATEAPNPAKAAAYVEGEADLGEWVRFALTMAKAKGTVTFIHRAGRIDTLIGQLAGRAGEIVIFPLWPGVGKPASRVLVRARKQIAAPARIAPGLVLHETDGRFTAAAEAVLRGGEGLVL